MKYILAFLLFISAHAFAEPTFTIYAGSKTFKWTTSELLKNAQTVNLETEPTYKGKLKKFKAVPVSTLLKDVPFKQDEMLQFTCLDKFSAPIDKDKLLSKDPQKAIAYLAVEDPKEPWPSVSKKIKTAGPFYLIWKNAEASKIGSEEWPFQLESFTVKGSLLETYPLIFPNEKTASSDAKSGFKVFTKNCFACHKMNGQGLGDMGPDLNLPMSVTEYWQKKAFQKLVRDPRQVRAWPNLQMNVHFAEKDISNKEIDQLWTYFEQMAKQR